jgi:serine/threonine protein kinase
MNILVKHDERMYAKVADFGLSRTRLSSWTYSNLTNDVGSTRWMAPELFGDEQDESSILSSEADKNYSFKVDVYSFGMVCYEIMTGHIPFPNVASMTDLRKMIKYDGLRPKIPEQYPECLTTLVKTCYHSDPTTRPLFVDICAELRHIKCSLMVCSHLHF